MSGQHSSTQYHDGQQQQQGQGQYNQFNQGMYPQQNGPAWPNFNAPPGPPQVPYQQQQGQTVQQYNAYQDELGNYRQGQPAMPQQPQMIPQQTSQTTHPMHQVEIAHGQVRHGGHQRTATHGIGQPANFDGQRSFESRRAADQSSEFALNKDMPPFVPMITLPPPGMH